MNESNLNLNDELLQRIIDGIASAIMQSKPMQWVISQMPPDWVPGSGEADNVAAPAGARSPEQVKKFSRQTRERLARNPEQARKYARQARDYAMRSIQAGTHMSFDEALLAVASDQPTVPWTAIARDPAEAKKFSRMARDRAMRSIRAGKHMTFAEALAEVVSSR